MSEDQTLLNIAKMAIQFGQANDATNEQLARRLIHQSDKPHCKFGSRDMDLYEACADRLFPGIFQKMADEENAL